MSLVLGLPGLVAVLGGIVVLLRRRDFRQMKANNVPRRFRSSRCTKIA